MSARPASLGFSNAKKAGLGAPLDVFVVRKLGVPGHEELAMGAIGNGGVLVLNGEVVTMLGISTAVISAVSPTGIAGEPCDFGAGCNPFQSRQRYTVSHRSGDGFFGEKR